MNKTVHGLTVSLSNNYFLFTYAFAICDFGGQWNYYVIIFSLIYVDYFCSSTVHLIVKQKSFNVILRKTIVCDLILRKYLNFEFFVSLFLANFYMFVTITNSNCRKMCRNADNLNFRTVQRIQNDEI